MARQKAMASKTPGLDITLQDVIDGLEDELLVIDSEYRVKFANVTLLSKLQDGAKSPIDKLCYKVFHNRDKPCSSPLWECPLKEVLKKGSATTAIHSHHVSGAHRYLKITAFPLRDSRDNIKFIVELIRDVTAERDLETQILKRHHQLLALNHISSAVSGLMDLDAILKVALDNVLEIVSGAIGGILLLDEHTNTLYYRVQRGLSATYADGMRIGLGEGIAGRVAQTGEPVLLEDVSKSPDAVRPDLVSAEGLKGFVSIPLRAKDNIVGVMNIASNEAGRFGSDDVFLLNSIGDYLGTAIEQAKLYEGLRESRDSYQRLLRHALTAQEKERKKIAQELHDETSQTITSLTLSLQAIIGMAEVIGIEDTEFIDKLRTTHANTIRAGNEIVKLMKELRPTLLDELGMSAAIHRYAKDNLETQGINVTAESKGADRRFPSEVEVTLFRVAQGAIGNILEHSEAKNAIIKLECNASECLLNIEDDGKGFDVSKITKVDPSGRGTGLFTIKERASLIGGTCRVESQRGHGTKVTVKVPITGDVSNEENKGARG